MVKQTSWGREKHFEPGVRQERSPDAGRSHELHWMRNWEAGLCDFCWSEFERDYRRLAAAHGMTETVGLTINIEPIRGRRGWKAGNSPARRAPGAIRGRISPPGCGAVFPRGGDHRLHSVVAISRSEAHGPSTFQRGLSNDD
jgi:hypothetical protein